MRIVLLYWVKLNIRLSSCWIFHLTVRAFALTGGATIAARRNLVLHDWCTDSDQKASALRVPFDGVTLFGSQLEDKLHKLFKEKKHSSSLKQPAPVSVKGSAGRSPFRQSSRRNRKRGNFQFRDKDKSSKKSPPKRKS